MDLIGSLNHLRRKVLVIKKFQNGQKNDGNSARIPFYRKLVEPSMCLSPGAILIYNTLELFVCPPIKLQQTYSFTFLPVYRLVDNPLHKLKIRRIIRVANLSFITSLLLFSLCRLAWLKVHWKENRGMEQLFLYMVFLCMVIIGLGAWEAMYCHKPAIKFALSARFKLVPLHENDLDSKKRTLGDIFMYGFGLGCAAFPLLVLLIPVQFDYDPLSIIFEYFSGRKFKGIIKLVTKLGLGLVYVIFVGHGAGMFLSVMMLILIFTEGLQTLTNQLYIRGKQTQKQIRFPAAYKSYRMAQVLITSGNSVVEQFLFVLVVLGWIFAGMCAYASLMMYHELPLLTYLACPVIVAVALAINFVLISFAYVPYRNVEIFKQYWKQVVQSKLNRKILKSCPPLGYNIGPIKNVHLLIAMKIANAIVNCTLNLVLLKATST